MTKMINATRHPASKEQAGAGVIDLDDDRREILVRLLTFDDMPDGHLIVERAGQICAQVEMTALTADTKNVMIGGAPFLMRVLEDALVERGFTPFYAFSKRVATEKNGVKTSVFAHLGFVEAVMPKPIPNADTCNRVNDDCAMLDCSECGKYTPRAQEYNLPERDGGCPIPLGWD